MKIRTAIISALTTLSLSSAAFAQTAGGAGTGGTGGASAGAGGTSAGSGGTSGSGAAGMGATGGALPTVSYFNNVTPIRFPASPCNDPANAFKLGCYTSFLVVSDLDGDGDLDIVFANGGGYYTPDETVKSTVVSGVESSSVYFNDSKGNFYDVTVADFGDAKSRLRQVAIADVDGDGDMDLYQPGGYGLDNDKLFIQTSPSNFANQAATRLPADLKSRAGSAHFGDLDGDGDVDLVVGDWGESPRQSPGNTLIYLNDGKGVFTAQPLTVVPAPLDPNAGRTPIDMDLADVDGDFDLDILVNHRNGQSRIFLNDGKGQFSDGTVGNYPAKNGPYTYNVEACDFDEDGDLDLLLDNAGGHVAGMGNISQVLVNDGKGKFTDETSTRITNEPYADDNAVKCADINGDGHYDFLVASLEVPEKLLLNDGTGHFKFSPGAFPNIIDPTLGIDIGDLDGDKKPDVITGQGEGTPRLDLYYAGNSNVGIDTTAPKFRKVETPVAVVGAPTVLRFAVLDGYTSDTGEHVKSASVSYTVNGGAAKTIPAKFIGGDLFRVVIPAQPDGTLVQVTPTAVDRVGLVGTAAPVTLAFGVIPGGGGGGTGGGGRSGGEAGEAEPGLAGAGGEAEGGGPTVPSGGAPTSTGGASSTGGKAAGGGATPDAGASGDPGAAGSSPGSSDDDGCGCSVAGQPSSAAPLLASLGLALLAFRRKRNRMQ